MEEVEEMYTTQTKMASVSTESPSSCYPGSYWLPAFSFPQGQKRNELFLQCFLNFFLYLRIELLETFIGHKI